MTGSCSPAWYVGCGEHQSSVRALGSPLLSSERAALCPLGPVPKFPGRKDAGDEDGDGDASPECHLPMSHLSGH